MRISKSIAVQVAIGLTVVGTYFAVSSQADDMTINNPAPITEQVEVQPVPTPAPAVDATASPEPEVVAAPVDRLPVPNASGAPRNPPPWTPIPLPAAVDKQPEQAPPGKRWQEGPGCDMSVQGCTAVDVTDPMPDGCMAYDNLKHECVQWKDSP